MFNFCWPSQYAAAFTSVPRNMTVRKKCQINSVIGVCWFCLFGCKFEIVFTYDNVVDIMNTNSCEENRINKLPLQKMVMCFQQMHTVEHKRCSKSSQFSLNRIQDYFDMSIITEILNFRHWQLHWFPPPLLRICH